MKKQCWFCGKKSDMPPSEIIINKETDESKPICWKCCEKGLDWVEKRIETKLKEMIK